METKKIIAKLESLYGEMKEFKDIERAHLAKLIRTELEEVHRAISKLKQDVLNLHYAERISFTLQEAADITGFSYATLYNWGRSGKLKVSQPEGLKGKTVVSRQTLIQFIMDHEVPINQHNLRKDKK